MIVREKNLEKKNLLEFVGKMRLKSWKLVNFSFYGFDKQSYREYSGAKL